MCTLAEFLKYYCLLFHFPSVVTVMQTPVLQMYAPLPCVSSRLPAQGFHGDQNSEVCACKALLASCPASLDLGSSLILVTSNRAAIPRFLLLQEAAVAVEADVWL